ncbi:MULTISPECIES: threonine-phosphate decarboxylase CobD [Pseudomonas]|uniref:threonine-phosphate decarboxylase n=1 Tax=Pseudomonas tritici TaxID=2745518 RepID=A0A8H9YIA5_9PSED|nr:MULTISPECIES: threonine-phosphate decarboxylase CobD [Pseudomonas]MBP2870780.1 threonine-phosphate decarboxylase [Pseudomonas sp. SWRI144]MBW8128603.1 threonine-phosphate decarboxylase CobD [Pseudomonas sp. LAP_36]MBW8137841.1 threonine-phosphate decarboxylase CobD [Pseudomonas sp. PAMC 26818]QXH82465.1 threonine-phosphate decarboxylase CobD [Pseudomonas tritici]CRM02610.1 Histidinol-phosphate aminotransferase [Pseudomonas sp. 24 R 17]
MLEHGGRLRKAAIQYGIAEADWLDLSSGLAPWPWAIPEIPLRAWARLPETDDGLEQAASEYYGAAHLLPVAGSQAAIQLLPRLRRAGKVGVLSPCYAEHAEAWRRAGYVVREVLEQEVDFFLDGLDVLVVVNPNNPTGLSLNPQRLLDWHSRLAQRGGWLVVDEAFMDVTPELSLAGQAHQVGLIVLRSFGKFFGLAGVRLGFVLAERKLLKLLAEQVGPWAVSGPTRVLGRVCLRDTAGQAQQRARCIEASQRLFTALERHGFQPQGGCALFQWLITPHAERMHEFMAQRGILLRLFVHNSSLRFGLPDTDADWQRLDEALAAYKDAT